jgi:hypothetical protein
LQCISPYHHLVLGTVSQEVSPYFLFPPSDLHAQPILNKYLELTILTKFKEVKFVIVQYSLFFNHFLSADKNNLTWQIGIATKCLPCVQEVSGANVKWAPAILTEVYFCFVIPGKCWASTMITFSPQPSQFITWNHCLITFDAA